MAYPFASGPIPGHLSAAATLAINAVTGNDGNDGSVGAPLRSWREFRRRFERVPFEVVTEVQIQTSLPAGDPISGEFIASPTGFLRPTGRGFETDITPGGAGTLAVVTPMNPATNQSLTITDAAVVSYAPFVGKRVRWTSGPALGAIAWIELAVGASAVLSASVLVDDQSVAAYTLVEPVAGNTYVIEDLVSIPGLDFVIDSPEGSSTTGFYGYLRANIDSVQVDVTGSALKTVRFDTANDFMSCGLSRSRLLGGPTIGGVYGPFLLGTRAEGNTSIGSQYAYLIADSHANGVQTLGSAYLQLEGHTSIRGAFPLAIAGGANVSSSFGEGFAAHSGITVFASSSLDILSGNRLWGSAPGYGLWAHSGSLATIGSTLPTLTGASGDVKVAANGATSWATALSNGFDTTYGAGVLERA